jgi:hypothetical protein
MRAGPLKLADNPNIDTLAQEALALNQLYKSISLEMKSKCIDKECETVATAVDKRGCWL